MGEGPQGGGLPVRLCMINFVILVPYFILLLVTFLYLSLAMRKTGIFINYCNGFILFLKVYNRNYQVFAKITTVLLVLSAKFL